MLNIRNTQNVLLDLDKKKPAIIYATYKIVTYIQRSIPIQIKDIGSHNSD